MISINRGYDFYWTGHAIERWNERFAGINKDLEFSSAKPCGRKTKKKIKQLTPVNAERYMHGFNGRYYLLGRSNIVFVIESSNDHIVTVFHVFGEQLS